MKKTLFLVGGLIALLLAPMPAQAENTNVERDYEIALTKGQYAIELKDYPEAISYLERALELKPNDQAARVSLGVAYARSGNPAQAREVLQSAVDADPSDARARYELALVLSALGRQEEATAQMTKAAQGTDPEVSAQAKSSLGGTFGGKKPFSARLAGGLQFDSNVILEQDSAVMPGVKNSDWRYLWTADLAYAFLQSEKTEIAAGYDYYGTLHHSLKDYNVEQHQGRLAGKYAFTKTTALDLEYAFLYTSLHGDHYNTTHHFALQLSSSLTPASLTALHGSYEAKRFFAVPVSTDAPDRSGTNAAGGITHTMQLGKKAGVAFDYTYDSNTADVDTWSYSGNRLSVNALAEWNAFRPYALASYYDRQYDSVGGAGTRHDKVQEYAAGVTWKAGTAWAVTLADDYTFNDSNMPVYTYTRNIVSIIAEIRL